MENKRILVTGGTGMVGKYLKDILPKAEYVGSKDFDLRDRKETENLFGTFSYGFTKRSLLVAIDAYNKQYGTKYNYLTPCNLYGEHDRFDDPNKCHFITALIRKIIDAENDGKNEINLFGTGAPLRQFMYAGDLARVIKIVIENDITDSFNIATMEENTISDMANIALGVLNKNMNVVFDATKPDGQKSLQRGNKNLWKIEMRSFGR